jgi:hypothetical protein
VKKERMNGKEIVANFHNDRKSHRGRVDFLCFWGKERRNAKEV